jgi:transcription antitermination factor NusG
MDAEGSLYYVKTGKEIARVNETVVNNIKLATSQTKDIEVSDSFIQPGRQLVINKGVLTGLTCEVVRVDSKKKLLVRVDLLQRNILLSLSEENFVID